MEIIINRQNKYIFTPPEDDTAVTLCKGIDVAFERDVAIKIIPLGFITDKRSRFKAREKAQNELRALIKVSDISTGVPCVLDQYYDEKDDKLYIITQWVNGHELGEKMRTSSDSLFLDWMVELCCILSEMQKVRLCHRDIKPANIMIDSSDKLRLIDFNLSIADPDLISGTKNYKAPEMSDNFRNNFEKADMFSIGVIMYERFAHKLPLLGKDYTRARIGESANTWSRFDEPKTKDRHIPESVNAIITRCMKYDPADRYADYRELMQAIKDAKKEIEDGKNRKRSFFGI